MCLYAYYVCEVYVCGACTPMWEVCKPGEAKGVCWLHCSRTFPLILLQNDFSLPRSRLVVSKPHRCSCLLPHGAGATVLAVLQGSYGSESRYACLDRKHFSATKSLFRPLNSLLNSNRNKFIGEIQCWHCCCLRKQNT